MRADRLIELLLFLQAKGQVTAAQVAKELEVSERTARRDLDALLMSGVPLYSTPGRGGGWSLIGGAKTDLSGLSAPEAQELFLALGPALGKSPKLKSALGKLLSALPETFKDNAELASQAIKVDPTGWSRVGASKPLFLDQLTAAVVAEVQCRIEYKSRDKDPAERVVHPLGLVTKRDTWYLIANTNKGMRTFRLDRVSNVATLESSVERPPNFDLDEEWKRITTVMDKGWVSFTVVAKVKKRRLVPLRWIFGKHLQISEEEEGWVPVKIGAYNIESCAAQLAGFGADLILEDPPPELLRKLQQITKELSSLYKPGDL